MTNFDRDRRDAGYGLRTPTTGWSSGSWIAAAVIAIIAIIAIGYMFNANMSGKPTMVEQRATTTDTATPLSTPAANPSPAMTPSAAPSNAAKP